MSRSSAIIAAAYGDRNAGDDAIAMALAQHFLAGCGVHQVVVLTLRHRPDMKEWWPGLTEACLLRVSGWSVLLPALRDARVWVIGGGGVLQDATSLANLMVHAGSALFAKMCRIPVAVLGVGIGPLHRPIARRLAGWIVRTATFCLVRDAESGEFCSRFLSPGRFAVGPDLAFSLSLHDGQPSVLAEQPRVVISLRPPVGDKHTRSQPSSKYLDNLRAIVALTARLAGEYGLGLRVLATHADQDRAIWEQLQPENLGLANVEMVVPESPRRWRNAISRGDVVVAMRMHALLFAAREGAALVALAYDKKVGALARSLGCDRQVCTVGPDGDCDLSALEAMLERALLERSAMGGAVLERALDLKQEARHALAAAVGVTEIGASRI